MKTIKITFKKRTLLITVMIFALAIGVATGGYFWRKAKIESSKKAIVTIVFDDDDVSIYNEAFKRMKALGLKGTNYNIGGFIGQPGKMTKEQLQEMYDSGWSISNHTKLHWNLTGRSDVEVVNLVKGERLLLISNGWTKGADEFCPPQNSINDRELDLIRPYIHSSTDSQKGINNIPFDRYHISRSGAFANKPEAIIGWVDKAIEDKQYVHLNFHKIGSGTVLDYSPENFQRVIEYVAQKRNEGKIEVKTMYELIENCERLNQCID
ncbi:polysaccharide deacetylase family protein [Candidatus Parcubacteria bacterium]|nr:polysaccharide deacetylase family protein [Patescibacteria group bacterium]MBU4308966.1 polysaccharide deacetylase family protein [Patescibacteria group bacterium]MBU4431864.1 polysaccharide deacetylase family protein [Patescibacteria group bacterium]MBU4577326.1 polysaccharide deacetylase family protein [Patescibacteria group bacterium]MCG2697014.1 polysaccharide deacetylase family protein [Candidatus Parcubacteria bacterium]